MTSFIKHVGWGNRGKIAADERAMRGSIMGAAARAQNRRKTKVPLTLAPCWGAIAEPPTIEKRKRER